MDNDLMVEVNIIQDDQFGQSSVMLKMQIEQSSLINELIQYLVQESKLRIPIHRLECLVKGYPVSIDTKIGNIKSHEILQITFKSKKEVFPIGSSGATLKIQLNDGSHLTTFEFVPKDLLGVYPQMQVQQLITNIKYTANDWVVKETVQPINSFSKEKRPSYSFSKTHDYGQEINLKLQKKKN